jgi:hypothetical protein
MSEVLDQLQVLIGQKGMSIDIKGYASFVLATPEVQETLTKIYAYVDTVDRMHDSLVLMVDSAESFPLNNDYEKGAFREILCELEGLKRNALMRTCEPLLSTVQHYEKERKGLTPEAIAIKAFASFMEKPRFVEYLMTRKIPYIDKGPIIFNSREEELHMVFSLFLWTTRVFINSDCLANWTSFLQTHRKNIRLDGSGPIRLCLDSIWGGMIRIEGVDKPITLLRKNIPGIEARFPVERHTGEYCAQCNVNFASMDRQPAYQCGKSPHSFCDVWCRNEFYYPGQYQ